MGANMAVFGTLRVPLSRPPELIFSRPPRQPGWPHPGAYPPIFGFSDSNSNVQWVKLAPVGQRARVAHFMGRKASAPGTAAQPRHQPSCTPGGRGCGAGWATRFAWQYGRTTHGGHADPSLSKHPQTVLILLQRTVHRGAPASPPQCSLEVPGPAQISA